MNSLKNLIIKRKSAGDGHAHGDASASAADSNQKSAAVSVSESSESAEHEYDVNGELVHTTDHEKKFLEDVEQLGKNDEEKKESSIGDYARFNRNDIMAIIPGDPNDPDDYDLPASTVRMWVFAIVFGAVVSGVDSFFSMRFPAIMISDTVIIMITYPCGRLWHRIFPDWTLRLPYGMSISLNPGPFNYKEHACVFIFTNLMTSAKLVNNLIIEDTQFFKVRSGIGRQILINISLYCTSFSILGLAREIMVTPEDRVWPGMLSRIAMFKTFHSRDNPVANGWTMRREWFFLIVFFCAFAWYWVPDLLMPFTSYLGAWISWCKPSSATLSQVFGVRSGLGLFPLTLDWAQMSSISNPLTTPFWAIASMFLSFVFWIWIVMPALYYTNHWSTAHFPIMSNNIYTVDKKIYNFQEVANKDWTFNKTKFATYGPAILPIAFLINIALGLAIFTAVVVHFALLFYEEVIIPWRNRGKQDDPINDWSRNFKAFPRWIYVVTLVISLGLGFAFSEGWDDSPIRAGGYIVSLILGVVLFIPISLVEARSNCTITIDSFFYVVGANWFEGNALRLLYFYTIGFGIIQNGMYSAQSAKVGHYLRISPRIYMTLLFVAGIWSSMVSPSVCWYILTSGRFGKICTPQAENNMLCRSQQTRFNTQGVWGMFGSHIFASGGRYVWVLWFLLVGAVVPAAHFAYLKWRPKSKLALFDPVLFFTGAELIPFVTGYNFSTWFVCSLIFNWLVHSRYTAWWRKYNLVTSVGLDGGTAITIILVYFGLFYTGASKRIHWWGTEVASKGCDAKGCPYKNGPLPRPTGY